MSRCESPNRPRHFHRGIGHGKNLCKAGSKKNLTNEEKEKLRNVCLELLERIEYYELFFKHVITGDEAWIFQYDPRNQTTKFGEAHEQLTAPEENKNEQIENQIHANLFFRHSGCCS